MISPNLQKNLRQGTLDQPAFDELTALLNIVLVASADEMALIDGVTAGEYQVGKVLSLNDSGVLDNLGTVTIGTITTLTSTTVIAGAIVGGDNSLGITGQTQATTVNGGVVVIAGAASIAGATGNGGAASMAGGASGSTDGAGGAASVTGGVGTGTGAGGAASITGGEAPATGNGGGVDITGGATTGGETGIGGTVMIAGGANANTTNGDGGDVWMDGGAGKGTGVGGGVAITGGDSAGAGDGGPVDITPGTSGSGAAGVIRLAGTIARKQGAPTTVTTAATLTVAQMLSGIITGSDTDASTVNLTLPTGTAMDAALPSDFVMNDAFDIVIINLSPDEVADTYTLVENTGSGDFTIVGPAIIASSHADAETNAATFRCRKTATNTFVAYRIS